MRPLPSRSLLLCLLIGPAAALSTALSTACGGSTASNAHGADAGAMDASNVDTGTPKIDSGVVVDSGVVDSGMVDDGGACPVVSGSGTQATHGNPPVVSNLGGPVLHSPTVVTLTFQDTANVAALQAFGATIGSTPWFAQVLGDYTGTTSTPAGLSVAIAANADTTYVDNGGVGLDDAGAGSGTDLNAFMNQAIANAVAAQTIPSPDGNTVYMFYFPSTTTITGFVGPSCQAYGGYHFNQVYVDGKTPIYYAVLPDCAAGSPYELEALTVAASHELVEAVSDPAPNTGWSLDTSPYPDAGTTPIEFRNDPWLSLGYGEIADNCEGTDFMLDAGTVVQRIWSNSAATGGHDTSTPRPTGPSTWPTWATPSPSTSPPSPTWLARPGSSMRSTTRRSSRPTWGAAAPPTCSSSGSAASSAPTAWPRSPA
jgi:hypothetical protein